MTRFARAKGSKSSNEKRPEDATSWLEMKKALLNKSTCQTSDKSVDKSIGKKNFEYSENSNGPAKWASLDNDTVENNFSIIRQHHKTSLENKNIASKKTNKNNSNLFKCSSEIGEKGKQIKINGNKIQNQTTDLQFHNVNVDKSFQKCEKSSKKNKRKLGDKLPEEPLNKKQKKQNVSNVTYEQSLKNKKKKLKRQKKVGDEKDSNVDGGVKNFNSESKLKNNEHGKKNKIKKVLDHKDHFDSSKDDSTEHKNKKVKKPNLEKKSGINNVNYKKNSFQNKKNDQKEKKINNMKLKHNKNSNSAKKKYNKNHGKQEIVNELIVNGEKIQIVKFQGFNITLEDAERLKKLKADMFKEGIPKEKLEAALKLERRRAEKALSRLKKAVCFQCRGFGHVLSQCPLLTESQNTGTGICYKCGSTEHSALECKVVKGSNFQFAECFICKEQGHIAKQCPDNPRGLYPNGGACKECGSVTHLKKDCPKVLEKKENELITVGVRNDRNIELLDEEMLQKNIKTVTSTKTKNSIVKF